MSTQTNETKFLYTIKPGLVGYLESHKSDLMDGNRATLGDLIDNMDGVLIDMSDEYSMEESKYYRFFAAFLYAAGELEPQKVYEYLSLLPVIVDNLLEYEKKDSK